MVPSPPRRASAQWPWIALGIIAAASLGGLGIVGAKWPFSEKALAASIEHATGGRVEWHNFRSTYFPPGATAENVKLFRSDRQPDPLIQVDRMAVRGSFAGMWATPKHISELQLHGFHFLAEQGTKTKVLTKPAQTGSSLIIDKVVADNSTLRFAQRNPGKPPFELAVRRLVLHNVDNRLQPLDFQAVMAINEPPGEIHASGKLGPWNTDDFAATPARGNYALNGARLDVFTGLSGNLNSTGVFNGNLGTLHATGDVNIPDFHLTRSHHTVPLETHYDATVDTFKGDVTLNTVSTRELHTTVVSHGSVGGEDTPHHGKTVDLQASVQGGRLSEVMLIFIKANVAPMTGTLKVNTAIRLPPGPEPFLQRLYMNGDFHISGAEFTKEARQVTLDKLSASAAGEKVHANSDLGTVLSDLQGHCVVKDGVATLSNVIFQFPGSTARIRGSFNLISQQVNFQGNLQTEGELSDTQKGIKKLFVKVVVAIHRHRSPQHQIPFKITGAYGDPQFALNDDPLAKKRR